MEKKNIWPVNLCHLYENLFKRWNLTSKHVMFEKKQNAT